jgi:beta-glucanase (GH16 family)
MKSIHCIVVVLGFAMTGHQALAAPAPVWSDEFDQAQGAAPNPAKWVCDLGGGGWGNHELEVYTDARENVRVVADPAATDGKALAITAVRTAAGGYTSARLKTQGLFMTIHGRVEARMKLPRGQGFWSAFWMLGNNIGAVGWPACGEIDIMENLGHRPGTVYGTLHGPGYSGSHALQRSYKLPDRATFDDGYHIFAVEWATDRIQWSVDDHVYHVCTPADLPSGAAWVFNGRPFFLLLNLSVGGDWPGNPDATTVFPQTLYVDYVRVFAPMPQF